MRKVVGAAVGGVVFVLVGASIGGAAWSGRVVTGKLTEQTKELGKLMPTFRVVDEQIDHGLFTSTRKVTLELGCLPGSIAAPDDAQKAERTPIRFSMQDVVHHGPLPQGKGFGAASIDTAFALPSPWDKEAEKLFGKLPPLSVHTDVGFGGETASTFTVPRIAWSDAEHGRLDVNALVGTVHGQSGRYTLDMPAFELHASAPGGPNTSFKIGQIHSETVVAPQKSPSVWLVDSTSKGTMSSMEMVMAPGTGALPLEPVKITFGHLSFSADSTVDKGLWSSTTRYSGSGRINDVQIDKMELAASLKRVHAETYQRAIKGLFGTLLSCEGPAFDPASGPPEALMKDLMALLVHDPEYALDKLAIELAGKRAELSYGIGTRGVTDADLAAGAPEQLVNKVILRASAAVSLGLIEQLLAKIAAADPNSARAVGGNGDPSSAAQTMMMLEMMVGQGVEAGYLTRDGDVVKANAAFEGGQLLINGKPMPLDDLPGIAQ